MTAATVDLHAPTCASDGSDASPELLAAADLKALLVVTASG